MARKKRASEGPIYYTTFQVAKMLGVSPPTVVNWINSGLVTAYRTPGGHRRITQDELVTFAQIHNYPLAMEGGSEAEAPTGERRVLIVDDEPDFCDLVRNYLQVRGNLEVEVALSGFAAGLTIARFKPAVVVMDILMPDMDGFEVLKMMRSDPEMQEIPVIACTAYRDPQIEDRVRRESFHGYIEKPLKLDRLLEMIEQAMRGQRLKA
jgi:excisionase family DNA binding protein